MLSILVPMLLRERGVQNRGKLLIRHPEYQEVGSGSLKNIQETKYLSTAQLKLKGKFHAVRFSYGVCRKAK